MKLQHLTFFLDTVFKIKLHLIVFVWFFYNFCILFYRENSVRHGGDKSNQNDEEYGTRTFEHSATNHYATGLEDGL